MLKALAHKTILFYLAFSMLLASIAIPYTAHTCYISNQKDYHVLSLQDNCHSDASGSCHDNKVHFDKRACCGIEKGIIDFSTELHPNLAKNFVANLSFAEIKLLIKSSSYNNKVTYFEDLNLQKDIIPIHIALQQFRC